MERGGSLTSKKHNFELVFRLENLIILKTEIYHVNIYSLFFYMLLHAKKNEWCLPEQAKWKDAWILPNEYIVE